MRPREPSSSMRSNLSQSVAPPVRSGFIPPVATSGWSMLASIPRNTVVRSVFLEVRAFLHQIMVAPLHHVITRIGVDQMAGLESASRTWTSRRLIDR